MNLESSNRRRHIRGTVDFFVNRHRLNGNDSLSLTDAFISEEVSQFATGAGLTNFFITEEVSQFNEAKLVSIFWWPFFRMIVGLDLFCVYLCRRLYSLSRVLSCKPF